MNADAGKLKKHIDFIDKNMKRLVNDLAAIKTLDEALEQFDDSEGEPSNEKSKNSGKRDEKK